MSHTNVKSEWIDGNLVFKDKAGNEILTINGADRSMTLPVGSTFTNSGTSYVVSEPDDVTLEVDGSDNLAIKAAGVSLSHLATEVTDILDVIADLPTTNQASPAIWNDGGVLKVGTA